jgi:hypothetical protein
VGIGSEIKPRRSLFDPRQRDQLERIEADRADMDRLGRCGSGDLERQRLQHSRYLDKLALAAVPYPSLQQVPQML